MVPECCVKKGGKGKKDPGMNEKRSLENSLILRGAHLSYIHPIVVPGQGSLELTKRSQSPPADSPPRL